MWLMRACLQSAVRSAVKNDGIAMTNLAYGEDYIGRLNSIDWQDEMSRTALQQNYNLSASGRQRKYPKPTYLWVI